MLTNSYGVVADISRVAAVVQVVTKRGDTLYGQRNLLIHRDETKALHLQLPATLGSAAVPRGIDGLSFSRTL